MISDNIFTYKQFIQPILAVVTFVYHFHPAEKERYLSINASKVAHSALLG